MLLHQWRDCGTRNFWLMDFKQVFRPDRKAIIALAGIREKLELAKMPDVVKDGVTFRDNATYLVANDRNIPVGDVIEVNAARQDDPKENQESDK